MNQQPLELPPESKAILEKLARASEFSASVTTQAMLAIGDTTQFNNRLADLRLGFDQIIAAIEAVHNEILRLKQASDGQDSK